MSKSTVDIPKMLTDKFIDNLSFTLTPREDTVGEKRGGNERRGPEKVFL